MSSNVNRLRVLVVSYTVGCNDRMDCPTYCSSTVCCITLLGQFRGNFQILTSDIGVNADTWYDTKMADTIDSLVRYYQERIYTSPIAAIWHTSKPDVLSPILDMLQRVD